MKHTEAIQCLVKGCTPIISLAYVKLSKKYLSESHIQFVTSVTTISHSPIIFLIEDRDEHFKAIPICTHLTLHSTSYTTQRRQCDFVCFTQLCMSPTQTDDAIICQRQGTFRLLAHNHLRFMSRAKALSSSRGLFFIPRMPQEYLLCLVDWCYLTLTTDRHAPMNHLSHTQSFVSYQETDYLRVFEAKLLSLDDL